jgi:DNA/RNA endonuclease YhcR with UshA esterase domain
MFKIALVLSILGIIGMIIFSGQLEPDELQIKEINPGMLDEEISVEGIVENLKESPNKHTYFLEIMDNTGKINVVIFEKEVYDLEKNNLKMNNLIKRRIKVLGTVTEYNGRLELILKDSKSLLIVS